MVRDSYFYEWKCVKVFKICFLFILVGGVWVNCVWLRVCFVFESFNWILFVLEKGKLNYLLLC